MAPARHRERLVVVGNGMAGLRLLEELVALAPGRFDITAIGAEAEPAYNRVLLSSLLAGEIGAGDVAMRPRGWYAEHGIALRTGEPAVALDSRRRQVRCATATTYRSIAACWRRAPSRSGWRCRARAWRA